MEVILIYLLKSAVLASIFILAYLFLLKNDTTFRHNRYFLLGGIFASLILPGVEFTRKVFVEATAPSSSFDISTTTAAPIIAPPVETDWWQVAGIIYFIIFSLLLLKFLFQFFSVFKVISGLSKSRKNGYTYCTSSENIKPFSFFRYIIYNPELHTGEELEMILTHEEAHARQWHSQDVLLVHLFKIVLWFNPLSWIYKKSLIRNLEYLADKEVAENAPSKKAYQKTLLKVTVGGFYPALTNPFYQSFLKKRIMMLNKNSSTKSPFWKTSLVFPFIFLFMITFNVKTEAQVRTAELVSVSYSYDPDLSAIITKDTKDEELESFKKDFAENGIVLDIAEIERSAEGIITDIALSYKDEKTGNSGSYSHNEPKGIAAFAININEGEVSIRSSFQTSSSNHTNLSKIGEKPLIVVEGKEFKKDDLNGKKVWIRGGLQVLNASEASEKYGSKAKDGVIVISEGEIIENYEAHIKGMALHNLILDQNYLWVKKGQSPMFSHVSGMKKKEPNAETIIANQRNKERTTVNFQDKISENPLFLISGKEYKKDNLNGKTIWIKGEMNVLDASEASESYGNKGNDGVILISEGVIIDDYQAHLKDIDSENKELNRKYIWISEGQKPLFATLINHKKNIIPDAEEIIAVQYDNESTVINTQKTRPLYVVNGEIQGKDFKIQSVQHEKIKSINVLKDESAVEKYGEKAKNGVIEIILKSKEEIANPEKDSGKTRNEKDVKKSVSFIVSDITFDDSDGKESTSISLSGVSSAMFDSKDALYVVNGKEMDKDFDPETIPSENIEIISVMEGQKAKEKYGQKAKKGVVEITTKK